MCEDADISYGSLWAFFYTFLNYDTYARTSLLYQGFFLDEGMNFFLNCQNMIEQTFSFYIGSTKVWISTMYKILNM